MDLNLKKYSYQIDFYTYCRINIGIVKSRGKALSRIDSS